MEPVPKELPRSVCIVLDPEGRILSLNQCCEELIGYAAEQLRGEHLWERLLPAEEVGATRRWLAALPGELSPENHDQRLQTAAGDQKLVRWSPVVLPGGNCVILAGMEVTDLCLPSVLAEREARLEAILETAVEGILTIDERGVIESLNPAAERMFGYSADELIGENVKRLMPSPYREEHDDYIRSYLNTGRARIIGIGRELEGLRKSGEVFPLDLAVSEVRLTGKRLFTGIVRDISDRLRAEEEARLRLHEVAHAARLLELGEMTSGIAHEVNQPLAAIVSFAEACLRMLKAGTADLGVFEGALEQIATQGARAGTIIHSLRQLSRKGEADFECVDINAMVRDVLALIGHEVRRWRVQVRTELTDALPEVRANRVQIEQVMLNLARNAIEALQDCEAQNRTLSIGTTAAPDGVVEVTVSDNGKGLPAEGSDRVFETFYTTKADGMGVGLSISRSIMEAHGGRLWATPNPSGGTVFHFTLRAGEADA